MNRKNLIQELSRTNVLWIVGLIFFSLGVILSVLLQAPEDILFPEADSVSPFWKIFTDFIPGKCFPIVLQFFLLLANAILFQSLVRKYELLRTLGVLTFFIYCFIATVSVPLHQLMPGSFAAFFMGLAYISVFESYRKEYCRKQVYNASFLIVLSSLFVPPLLFALPLFWLFFNIVNSFTFKRWLASILGALTVFWLLGGILFLTDKLDLLSEFFRASVQYAWVFSVEIRAMTVVFVLMLLLLLLLSVVYFLHQIHSVKISVRSALSFLLISLLTYFVYLFFFPAYTADFFLLSLGPFAVMVSFFYGSKVNKFSRLLLYLFLVVAVVYYLSFLL